MITEPNSSSDFSANWLSLWDLSPEVLQDDRLLLLEDAVTERLTDWMRHQPERLAQLFYRIDVPEEQFRAAFDLPTEAQQARALAQAAIARELQKAAFRRMYRKKRE